MDWYRDITDIMYEIIGYTKCDYYGTSSLEDIKEAYDEDDEADYIFYKYEDCGLVECSFGAACNTAEYETDRIFLFSYIEDNRIRRYHLTLIIDDPDDEV